MRLRLIGLIAGLLFAVLLAGSEARANWLTRILGQQDSTGGVATLDGDQLENALSLIRALPQSQGTHMLAAAATEEDHWRFVNRLGETFTAASPEELRRALRVLFPDVAVTNDKVTIYLTESTLFRHRARLVDLPQGASLHLVLDGAAYRLVRAAGAADAAIYAEARPGLMVVLTERSQLAEAIYQLARPLPESGVRMIAFEPGGSGTLSRSPRIDPASKGATIDTVDPDRLRHAMGSISRQTAVLTGRVSGELLYIKPATGPERSLLLRDLTAAADASDVNLVILNSTGARQPGSRNWLWRQISVRDLDMALTRATLGDFLSVLGGNGGWIKVSIATPSPSRTVLTARPARDLPGAPAAGPITGTVSDLMSQLAGHMVTESVEADLRSAARQRELDRRLVPGVRADVQWGYLGLFVLGLLGLRVARGWWQRIWPAERSDDYATRYGYRAACAVRITLLLLMFAPFVAPVSALTTVVEALVRALMGAPGGVRRPEGAET